MTAYINGVAIFGDEPDYDEEPRRRHSDRCGCFGPMEGPGFCPGRRNCPVFAEDDDIVQDHPDGDIGTDPRYVDAGSEA